MDEIGHKAASDNDVNQFGCCIGQITDAPETVAQTVAVLHAEHDEHVLDHGLCHFQRTLIRRTVAHNVRQNP